MRRQNLSGFRQQHTLPPRRHFLLRMQCSFFPSCDRAAFADALSPPTPLFFSAICWVEDRRPVHAVALPQYALALSSEKRWVCFERLFSRGLAFFFFSSPLSAFGVRPRMGFYRAGRCGDLTIGPGLGYSFFSPMLSSTFPKMDQPPRFLERDVPLLPIPSFVAL